MDWTVVVSIIGFGIIIFIYFDHQRLKSAISKPFTVNKNHPSATIDHYDLITSYGNLIDNRKELLGRESDLPASKTDILAALESARNDEIMPLSDAMYMYGKDVLESFVPNEQYDELLSIVQAVFVEMTSKENNDQKNSIDKLPKGLKHYILKTMTIMLKTNEHIK